MHAECTLIHLLSNGRRAVASVKNQPVEENLRPDGAKRSSIGGMNRRQFAVSLSAAGLLAGCDTDQKPAATATLLNSSQVQDAMKAVESAIGDLESDVGRFDDENWREVVPDVESAAADVRDAFEKLRSALQVPNS